MSQQLTGEQGRSGHLPDDSLSIRHIFQHSRCNLLAMLRNELLLLCPQLLQNSWVVLQVAEALRKRCAAGVMPREQQQQDVVIDLLVSQPAGSSANS